MPRILSWLGCRSVLISNTVIPSVHTLGRLIVPKAFRYRLFTSIQYTITKGP
jgi:hypothetical protein